MALHLTVLGHLQAQWTGEDLIGILYTYTDALVWLISVLTAQFFCCKWGPVQSRDSRWKYSFKVTNDTTSRNTRPKNKPFKECLYQHTLLTFLTHSATNTMFIQALSNNKVYSGPGPVMQKVFSWSYVVMMEMDAEGRGKFVILIS